MYIIIVYDVEVGRINKLRKKLKTNLNWVQNSVLEGEVTKSQFEKLKHKINELTEKDNDSVIIYKISNPKWIKREVVGQEKGITRNVL